MATEGFSAMGSIVTFDGVTLGEVESWDGGADALESEKILTCDSADMYADLILKAFDPGERTFTVIFQPGAAGNYALAKAKFDARTKGTLLLTYANTASFSAQAAITSLPRPSAPDAAGVQRFTISFTLAGKSDFTGVAA